MDTVLPLQADLRSSDGNEIFGTRYGDLGFGIDARITGKPDMGPAAAPLAERKPAAIFNAGSRPAAFTSSQPVECWEPLATML